MSGTSGNRHRARATEGAISRRRFQLAVLGAVVLSAGLIVASQVGARSERAADPTAAGVGQTLSRSTRAFPGVAQRGAVLGDETAPLTLVEYADLQCPYCGEWARRTLPVLVNDYVRSGKLRIVFRGLAFVGPQSQLALETAIAAGAQDRLWDVVDALYVNQGVENSGWVTEGLLADVVNGVGAHYQRVRIERDQAWVAREVAGAAKAAATAGVSATPSFELGRTGGRLQLVAPSSLDPSGMTPMIAELLRG